MRILRTVVLAAGLCLVSMAHAAPAAAQRTLTCESKNNKYKDCSVNTNGSARLVSTMSSTPCVYGRTWGFDYNSVWVDRGCRGKFEVGGSGSGWESGNYGKRITCESQNNSFNTCNVRTYGYVQVVRQLSSAPCVAGRTWGYQMDQIWVGNGCRAEFQVGGGNSNWQGDQRLITCESNDGNYSRCQTRTSGTVTLFKQISNTRCVQGRNWGYDAYGVWVNDGCRGEFVVGGGPGSGWGEYPGTWPGPGNGGGSPVARGRGACMDEAQRKGYGNISTNNANQNGNIVYVNMRGYRSSRTYIIDCQYSINQNRARITGEAQSTGGGGGNPMSQAKVACENMARNSNFQIKGSGPGQTQSWGVKWQMALQSGPTSYSSAYCNYMTSSQTAAITLGTPDRQR